MWINKIEVVFYYSIKEHTQDYYTTDYNYDKEKELYLSAVRNCEETTSLKINYDSNTFLYRVGNMLEVYVRKSYKVLQGIPRNVSTK